MHLDRHLRKPVSRIRDSGLGCRKILPVPFHSACPSIAPSRHYSLVTDYPTIVSKYDAPLAGSSPQIFLAQLHISEESRGVAKSLAEIIKRAGDAIKWNAFSAGDTYLSSLSDVEIKAGDRIYVRDTQNDLKEFEEVLEVEATLFYNNEPISEQDLYLTSQQQLAEIVISQGSPLDNTTLSRLRFRKRYQLVPLALHHGGKKIENLYSSIHKFWLRTGGIILVQGKSKAIAKPKRSGKLFTRFNGKFTTLR